jgi:hypothetical protein
MEEQFDFLIKIDIIGKKKLLACAVKSYLQALPFRAAHVAQKVWVSLIHWGLPCIRRPFF